MLELVENAEIEKSKKLEKKEGKQKEKNQRTERYLRCKYSCNCGESVCAASGLKQCEKCKDVMRSQCSKAKCKDGASKPSMIQVHYDEINSKKSKFHDTPGPTCSKRSDKYESEEEGDDYDEEDMAFEQYYLSEKILVM